MRRHGWVLVLVAVALSLPAGPPAGAEADEAERGEEAFDAKLVEDAAAILRSIWTYRGKGCGLGATKEAAGPVMKRAAGYYFEYVIHLAKSPHAVGGRVGTVAFDLQEEKGHVDEVRVTLPTGRYDAKALSGKLLQVARSLGVTLTRDDDHVDCWSGTADEGNELSGWLCFSLGDGVVRLEASP